MPQIIYGMRHIDPEKWLKYPERPKSISILQGIAIALLSIQGAIIGMAITKYLFS